MYNPEFFKPIYDKTNGTFVECNTAYGGARNTTEKHKGLLEYHQWSTVFPNRCDILDDYMNVDQDLCLTIDDGFKIKKN